MFMRSWGVTHRTSSPTYARANGQAERMVQVAKNLIKKSHQEVRSYQEGLQEIRNTPLTYGMLTPAELLQGRTPRSKIPCLQKSLFPHAYDTRKVQQAMEVRNMNIKFYHDKKAGPEKKVLQQGEQVRVQLKGQWKQAVVRQRRPEMKLRRMTVDCIGVTGYNSTVTACYP